jgi:phosphohistidine phosphatase
VKLYLVRHAIAEERDFERWPDDADRPLTIRGVKRFRRAARGLASVAPAVDVTLSSPYLRAWQTATLLAEEPGWPSPTVAPSLIPGSLPMQAVASLIAYRGAEAVAMVGHEPDLHRLASHLLTSDEGRVLLQFHKGAVALLQLPIVEAGQATLEWLMSPRSLRALANS